MHHEVSVCTSITCIGIGIACKEGMGDSDICIACQEGMTRLTSTTSYVEGMHAPVGYLTLDDKRDQS